MGNFDLIVVTAANESQAAGYRAQLAWRAEAGMLGGATKYLVLADPGGRRVGSFGATLNAIRESAVADWASARVLICHSGGDSKRTPAYAAQGKVFTPVPCRDGAGHPLAIFDLILKNAGRLPARPGILVLSGDVVLTFGGDDLARMDFSPSGATGVSYRDSVEQGSRHGVYAADGSGNVIDFLQKPDEARARAAGAVGEDGRVAVDTGLIHIAPDLCRDLTALSDTGIIEGLADGTIPQLDIYEEFLMALVPGVSRETYFGRVGARQAAKRKCRNLLLGLYDNLHNFRLRCFAADECDFFHIGSSRELLQGFASDCLTARLYAFAPDNAGRAAAGRAFIFNSELARVEARGPALVENCRCGVPLRLAGDNILTGLRVDAGAIDGDIALANGIGLVMLPVGETGWAAVAYGIRDDFKTPFAPGADGSRPCLFLNSDVGAWLSRTGVQPGALWRDDEALGMWSARLWRVGAAPEVLGEALSIASGTIGKDDFASGERLSISQLVTMVNHVRLAK